MKLQEKNVTRVKRRLDPYQTPIILTPIKYLSNIFYSIFRKRERSLRSLFSDLKGMTGAAFSRRVFTGLSCCLMAILAQGVANLF